jgi:hypothetical protein
VERRASDTSVAARCLGAHTRGSTGNTDVIGTGNLGRPDRRRNAHGVPFKMYTERPRRVESLLRYAQRWGARPHIQGDRVVTFGELPRRPAKARGSRRSASRTAIALFVLGRNGPGGSSISGPLSRPAQCGLANTWWVPRVANGLAAVSVLNSPTRTRRPMSRGKAMGHGRARSAE